MMTKPRLTLELLQAWAAEYAKSASRRSVKDLYGVTDGKAIGTHLEHGFRADLASKYTFVAGSSASGIDFPELGVDLKVTSITQPQSSCPFKSARQKVFGLDYSLLVFVYQKTDDSRSRSAKLDILHAVFVDKHRTADFTMTRLIRQNLDSSCNVEDLIALMHDRNLPVDEIEARSIAEELMRNPCEQGYLTISNALQWRLQYARVIEQAGNVDGILRIQ